MSQQTAPQRPPGPAGSPGRYQRSPAGMVVAMAVLVALVVGFVVFRGAFRDNAATPTQAVDYLPVARQADAAGRLDVVYPRTLPRGWTATSVEYRDGAVPSWHLGILTDAGAYVGVEQDTGTLRSLVRDVVDPSPQAQGSIALPGPGGRRPWQIWSDAGGDLALGRDLGSSSVVVVGTADQTDLETLLAALR